VAHRFRLEKKASMSSALREKFFGWRDAFDSQVTVGITLGIAAILLLTPVVVLILSAAGRIDAAHRKELLQRYYTWLALAPVMIGPVLLGAAWTIAAVFVLSLLCYREFARATGLFRERLISVFVVLGIVLVFFAALDHWYGLFMALFPLTVGAIAAFAIVVDRPKGYLQRVALGILGFALFGCALGHLAYFANDENYRPIVLMLLLCVELNDVFAYIVGKSIGRRKLAPNTSPNKTIGGALGALVLTTALAATLGHYIFAGTRLDGALPLLGLGIIISVVGQFGDLMLSSIKRDIGVKDIGVTLPGHGGLLDRFDSILLVAPATFHYIGFFVGIGLDQPVRVITGG
jgi:phosphatidate cytidylyltransferase